MIASIRDLRSKTREILNAVQRGDVVFVSNRGKTCAKIISVTHGVRLKKQSPAFGMWEKNSSVCDVGAYLKNLRKGRHAR